MIEHPLNNFKKALLKVRFYQGKVSSELFSGTKEELFEQYLQYRYLYEFGKLVTSQTQIDKIIDVLLDQLVDLIGAERCLLLLFDSHDKIIYQVGRNLLHHEITHPEFEVSWSIINQTRETLAAVCLKNALETDTFSLMKSVIRLRILSVVCVPILHEKKCIGVLYADNRTVRGMFQNNSSNLLRQFIELIAGSLASALQRKELENQISNLQVHLQSRNKYHNIIGTSPQVQSVIKFIDQVADTTATVLLEGESGTGKELVARAVHENSRRKTKPFVSLNCGALTETLLESELFGHVKGAFTGASHNKKGWFETADGGTIFFDEISEMSAGLQVKVLRILQTGEFSPVGGTEIKTCDVRIIAATNKHLESMIREGKFRSDLYYRLNILYLHLPPLRERREDIPLLSMHYLQHYSERLGKKPALLSSAVCDILMAYDFPGNIRELENAMQRVAVMAEGQEVRVEHLPSAFWEVESTLDGMLPIVFADAKKLVLERFERAYLTKTLLEVNGVVTRAAKKAGMDAKNFSQKMKKYHIRARNG